MARPELTEASRAEVEGSLDLLFARGRGFIVLVTDGLAEGHDLVAALAMRWSVEAVDAERGFAELDGRARVIWELPFLTSPARRAALSLLNQSRDRLAGLAQPVLMWVLDEDLSECWRVAQDLMDWASEILPWPSAVHRVRPGSGSLPPGAELGRALSGLNLSYRWSVLNALLEPGARCWLRTDRLLLHQAARHLSEFLSSHVDTVVVDMERADSERLLRWLAAVDTSELVLVLVGAFLAPELLARDLRAIALVPERAHPPAAWRRLDASVDSLEPHRPREPDQLRLIPTLVHDRASALDHTLPAQLWLADESRTIDESRAVDDG